MIKEYSKVIIMAVLLISLIVLIVVFATTDIDFGVFKNLSVSSISAKKTSVETLILQEKAKKSLYNLETAKLAESKKQYEAAKKSFENIDKSTIEMVQEATTDEKYFIEYLWIVLGNYADDNGLTIDIITSGSTTDTSLQNDSIKIVVKGRYANVADFVYEVENDKELKFKLDNIKMVYSTNNTIEATFNVLSLQVKK